jgi:hypothetical protein
VQLVVNDRRPLINKDEGRRRMNEEDCVPWDAKKSLIPKKTTNKVEAGSRL